MTMFSTPLLYLAILLPIVYVLYLVASSHVVRAVFARNVMSYFSGILGYLFIVVFVVVAAIMAFDAQFFTANLANLDQLTKTFPLLLLFIVPAITMTVWSEERKQGTDELLFTLPANDREILLGKYLAVVAVYSVALLFSTGLWGVLELYSDPGLNLFFCTYLGYWFAGAGLLAVGMFASALTRSSTVAFVLGAIFCAVPVFLSTTIVGGSAEFLRQMLGERADSTAVKMGLEFIESLTAFSVGEHLHEFGLGVVRLSSVLYFESIAVLFLYLNLIAISERLWSRRQKLQMSLQYVVRAASVLAILVSLYVVVTQSSGRADIDLTPQKYFTLTETTLETIDNIEPERPITIQAFLSADVPTEYVRTKRELTGLLRQIDQRGGNRVEIRMIDTAKYQPSADEAKSLGIEPRRVQIEQDGKFVTEDVFMGLVIGSSYDEVVVPFVGRGTPVEFELTRALRTVSNAHRMTVGILDTEAHVMSNGQTQEFLRELRKQYNVESVSASSPIELEKELFPIEDEAILKALNETKNAKDAEEDSVPKSLRELFKKKKHTLSDDLKFTFDAKQKTWQLRDLHSHRRYKIHLVKAEKKEEPAEKEKPAKEEEDKKKAKEAEKPKYAVFIERYDALVAVMPSTLTQSQMPNFVEYLKAGGPTLIFDDPLPFTLQPPNALPGLAPRLNLQPSSPFGGEPRAEGGTARSLMNALNLEWDNGEIAWDLYNPFPEYEEHWVQGLYTVIGQRKGTSDAVNEQSPITKGMGRMLLLYTGEIQEKTPGKMEFTPLLKSSKALSGAFAWEAIVREGKRRDRNPMTGQPMEIEYIQQILPVQDSLPPIDLEGIKDDKEKNRLLKGTRFQPDRRAHVFAAQIRGKAENKTNAVYIADADMISDVFFEIRREKTMNLDLDNVSFVLNAIDVLAGEDAFLELRRRKPPQPSLTEIEKQKEGLRAIQRAAVNKTRAGILEKQAKLRETSERLKDEMDRDRGESFAESLQKAFDAQMTYDAEKQKLAKEQKKLTDQLDRKIEEAKIEYERGVKLKENEIRLKAIVLPAIPAIAMGLIFLFIRLVSERLEIAPERRR